MTGAQMQHVWAEVAHGRGQHGSCMRSFAESYINAAPEVQSLLWEASQHLIRQYNLDQYLDTFASAETQGEGRKAYPDPSSES